MTDTVFVRGTGGAIFEMDIPTSLHARERFDQQVAKGDLTVIPHAVWVERADGSRYLTVPVTEEADGAPKKPAKAKAKATTEEPAAEAPEADTTPEG